MSPPRTPAPGRRTVVLLLAVLLTFAAIGTASGAAGRTGATTAGTHATGPVDGTGATDNDTLVGTVTNTTGDPNETVDGTTDTVDNTTNETTGTVDNTTNDTADGVGNTTDTVENTTDNTTDAVGDTTNETVDAVEDAVDGTAEAVENTTDAVNDTIDATVETVEESTEETVESLQSATGPIDGESLSEVSTGSQTPASAGETTPPAEATPTPTPAAAEASNAPFPDAGGSVPAGVAVGAAIVLAGAAVRTGIAGGLAPGSLAVTAGARSAARAGLSRLTRLFAPLRYSRYDDSDPLDHEGRAEVYDAVEESPGTYLTAVSEETDIPLSTLRHHVRVLEEEGLLAGATVRGRRRLYPAHTENHELAAALNDEATAPVVDALARVGPASVSDLAEAVGKDASTLTHHLKRLEADGIVVRERDGRAIVNRLAPEARAALAPVEADAEPAEAPAGAD